MVRLSVPLALQVLQLWLVCLPVLQDGRPVDGPSSLLPVSFCSFRRHLHSVHGSEESKKSTISGLKSAEGYIRRQLAKNLNLRNTPEIRFILDESIEYGVNMSKLIDDVIEHDHLRSGEEEAADANEE